MSSRHDLRWACAVVVAATLAGCATDEDAPMEPPPIDSKKCQESTLTYQNFAAPFVIMWCRGCHGAALPANMRQSAPPGVDFDTEAQVRAAQARLLARATGEAPTMPPAGGPSAEERALFAEWLACGMK
jgi:uncharacterized membrane protein